VSSAALADHLPGTPLRQSDLDHLSRSGIDAAAAMRAYLRRVDSATGADIVCRNGPGDFSGIAIPYMCPRTNRVRDYRLRRDRPEMEWSHGELKPRGKYLSPPGRGNMLYFVPGTEVCWLQDRTLPVLILEGEKKAIATSALAWREAGDAADRPSWLTVALPGVWNFRGKTGRIEGEHGGWDEIKGPIRDLDLIAWQGRQTTILFDVNASSNESVAAARRMLAKELRSRGGIVRFVDIPADAGVNGVDDLIGAWGSDRVLDLILTRAYEPRDRKEPLVLTEIGNAERFVNTYRGDVHFYTQTNSWLFWDGSRFAPDEYRQVERYAKATVRQLQSDALAIENKEAKEAALKFALRSESDHGIRALLNRAAAEEGITIGANDLDTDPYLLNVQNGTIDLRTCELRPHSRDDRISKVAPVRFDPDALCPRFTGFLEQVFEPHPDAIPFLQRAIGYSLTGEVSEECLFFLHGTGRNGKGTLLKTVQTMLGGDYASTADFSTFISRGDDRGPRDDVANMRGRRFVVSQEVREGAPLAEALVKWLTGGDRVRARNLYERSSEWQPTQHLWLAVNRRPVIRGTDTGIWSRIRLLPFDVSFEGREDRTLKQALQDELPGILAWAVRGCLEWQRSGLGTCESVQSATAEYRTESDQLARFIEERCIVVPNAQAKARWLYERYRGWVEHSGENAMTETTFGLSIRERGFQVKPTKGGKLYLGIGFQEGGDG
jgi:P4 family phage/plasmid primase-like protien